MQTKDLIVTGDAKVVGELYTKDGRVASEEDVLALATQIAAKAPAYTYQTSDPGAGSALTTGKLLIIYQQ